MNVITYRYQITCFSFFVSFYLRFLLLIFLKPITRSWLLCRLCDLRSNITGGVHTTCMFNTCLRPLGSNWDFPCGSHFPLWLIWGLRDEEVTREVCPSKCVQHWRFKYFYVSTLDKYEKTKGMFLPCCAILIDSGFISTTRDTSVPTQSPTRRSTAQLQGLWFDVGTPTLEFDSRLVSTPPRI